MHPTPAGALRLPLTRRKFRLCGDCPSFAPIWGEDKFANFTAVCPCEILRLLWVFPSLTRFAWNSPVVSSALDIQMLPFISKALEIRNQELPAPKGDGAIDPVYPDKRSLGYLLRACRAFRALIGMPPQNAVFRSIA